MTREEQIREAREKHPRLKDVADLFSREIYRAAFMDGAKWADATPSPEWVENVYRKELNQLKSALEVAQKALGSIQEYWNRDCNEQAMKDACEYAAESASEALSEIAKLTGGEK